MKRAVTVALLLALNLAACGGSPSGRPNATVLRTSTLCVDVGLPLSGADAAVGKALLDGIETRLPRAGVVIGQYRIRLCHSYDDPSAVSSTGAQQLAAHLQSATANRSTIAYIGELGGDASATAAAVLGQAGIPLLSFAGPQTAPPLTGTTAGEVVSLRPAATVQTAAVDQVSASHDCARPRRGTTRPVCTVVGTQQLCTALGRQRGAGAPRFCVLAGPSLTAWSSPARAYGYAAATVLLASLRAVLHNGDDLADRQALSAALRTADVTTPIGPVRFGRDGALSTTDFSSYVVSANGSLIPNETFRVR
jgi:ABC-type branched-subunit amino acid transport system substrate-binding protein